VERTNRARTLGNRPPPAYMHDAKDYIPEHDDTALVRPTPRTLRRNSQIRTPSGKTLAYLHAVKDDIPAREKTKGERPKPRGRFMSSGSRRMPANSYDAADDKQNDIGYMRGERSRVKSPDRASVYSYESEDNDIRRSLSPSRSLTSRKRLVKFESKRSLSRFGEGKDASVYSYESEDNDIRRSRPPSGALAAKKRSMKSGGRGFLSRYDEDRDDDMHDGLNGSSLSRHRRETRDGSSARYCNDEDDAVNRKSRATPPLGREKYSGRSSRYS